MVHTIIGTEINRLTRIKNFLVTAAAAQNQMNNTLNSLLPNAFSFPLTTSANSFFSPQTLHPNNGNQINIILINIQFQHILICFLDMINSAAAAAAAAASAANGVHSSNSLSPFFSFGGNLAAAAAAAAAANGGGTAAMNQNAAAALNFPQLANLLGSPVLLVSNLDENVGVVSFAELSI